MRLMLISHANCGILMFLLQQTLSVSPSDKDQCAGNNFQQVQLVSWTFSFHSFICHIAHNLMNFRFAIDESYQVCLTSFFLTLHIMQETSAGSSEDEWYKNTLATLKKFSPTSLKVTLRSVSSYFYTCSKFFESNEFGVAKAKDGVCYVLYMLCCTKMWPKLVPNIQLVAYLFVSELRSVKVGSSLLLSA